jgi:hypothetical protein
MHNDFYQIHLEYTRAKRMHGPSQYCEHCHANLLHVGPWGWPHLCKEIIYGTPTTLSFIPMMSTVQPVTNDLLPFYDPVGPND